LCTRRLILPMSDGMVELRGVVDRGNSQRKCLERSSTIADTTNQYFIIAS
jgi:hypothetical protein